MIKSKRTRRAIRGAERASQEWRRAAKQERSLRTEEAIGIAARRLLRTTAFREIRVADVARAAGVSVGGFYRRFRDKHAVLHLANEDVFDDCLEAFDAALSLERMSGRSLEGVARAYIGLMVRKFREHRTVMLQVLQHAGGTAGAPLRERVRAFNAHVHGRFRELLQQRASAVRHPDPSTALNLAIFIASAAARDAIWRDGLREYPVAVDDARLIDELTRSFVSYLTQA